jgi:hypothetical protein
MDLACKDNNKPLYDKFIDISKNPLEFNEYIESMRKQLCPINNIIITGATTLAESRDGRNYFLGVLNLIDSVFKYDSENTVTKIVVCDFGLTQSEIYKLKKIDKVSILFIPDKIKNSWSRALHGDKEYFKNYIYRAYALYIQSGIVINTNVLWLDAGVSIRFDPKLIFRDIQQNGIICFSTGTENMKNDLWTSPVAKNKLKELHNKVFKSDLDFDQFLDTPQIFAGLFGFNTLRYSTLLKNNYTLSLNKELVSPYNTSDDTHRIQSILSYLCFINGIEYQIPIEFGGSKYDFNIHRTYGIDSNLPNIKYLEEENAF